MGQRTGKRIIIYGVTDKLNAMKKVLLIDDNDDVRSNTAEILELSNYRVEVASNGKQGLEKAIAYKPDLIICDIMMPVLDGYGVLHALQKIEELKNIPFIFLTARSERMDLRKGMELGADDYITKPFSPTELLTAVDSRLKKNETLKNEFGHDHPDKNVLSKTPGKEALEQLVSNRHINKYRKKQLIYSAGNHPNRLYYLLSGKIKCWKANESGKELVTELYKAGDIFGYLALLEGGTYKDTAEAMEECELAIIPREDFLELLRENKEVEMILLQKMATRLAEKDEILLQMAYNSLRRKVADALLRVNRKYQETQDSKAVISLSRESLATIAGTATESLIRTLSDFKVEKLIDMEGGQIVLIDIRRLESLAN